MIPEALLDLWQSLLSTTVLDAVAQALSLDPEDARWRRAWSPKLPPGGVIVVHRVFGEDGPRVAAIEAHTPVDA